MKILFLADPIPSHTIKWVNSLSKSGVEILLFGLSDYNYELYNREINIEIYKTPKIIKNRADGHLFKSFYLTAYPSLKKVLKKFKPDILHSHYASSYGLLGALCQFHPFFLSVWGNDVFDFPQKTILHKLLLQYILSKPDMLFSTSKIMAKETSLYTKKKINIIPFGVDTDIFKPKKVRNVFKESDLVIGTVKGLEDNYGIEYLVKAFIILENKYPNLPLRLLIVGGGSLEKKLKNQAKNLINQGKAIFTGHIPHNKISTYHNMIDIAVFPSISESFGVSVIEASACGIPVIISDVGGMPEIIKNNVTGIKVRSADENSIAEAIGKLIMDKNLRLKMGEMGRERVIRYFYWQNNIDKMILYYESYLKKEGQ
ncbi:MAG: glycosyltransferase [Ignavibacteriaceae bacterium]|nr:glycosyltransferase [Ignavibacteriaceae bacterium]